MKGSEAWTNSAGCVHFLCFFRCRIAASVVVAGFCVADFAHKLADAFNTAQQRPALPDLPCCAKATHLSAVYSICAITLLADPRLWREQTHMARSHGGCIATEAVTVFGTQVLRLICGRAARPLGSASAQRPLQ
jgi:hypothetical protein